MAPLNGGIHRSQMPWPPLLVVVVATRPTPRNSGTRNPGSRHSSHLHNLYHFLL